MTTQTDRLTAALDVLKPLIVDRDLFAIPPTPLKDAKVLLAVSGGRVTHAAVPFRR